MDKTQAKWKELTEPILPHEKQNYHSPVIPVSNCILPDVLVQESISANCYFVGVCDARQVQRFI